MKDAFRATAVLQAFAAHLYWPSVLATATSCTLGGFSASNSKDSSLLLPQLTVLCGCPERWAFTKVLEASSEKLTCTHCQSEAPTKADCSFDQHIQATVQEILALAGLLSFLLQRNSFITRRVLRTRVC